MFQFDWASRKLWSQETIRLEAQPSKFTGSVRGAMLLQWHERCTECAVPLCYSVCPLYVERKDQKCARFVYGIVRNKDFDGLLSCGADLRFRRWGKLEARPTGRYMSLRGIRLFDIADRTITGTVNVAADLLGRVNPKRRLNGALTFYRNKALNYLGRPAMKYDEFGIECYSFEQEPFRMVVELRKNFVTVYRTALDMQIGYNSFSLPIAWPPVRGDEKDYLLMLYPDGDREVRVVFSWLDFMVRRKVVSATTAEGNGKSAVTATKPADKVKCVAWDLDNTLWQGILVEDGEENLRLRPEAEKLIRWFDDRGIIQTVVSKNNDEEAMAALKRFGLDEYFLYPATINWGQKSGNLQQVAERLNINIDTFALIDDSPFERREVSTALPMVRVFAEGEIEAIAGKPEFDVPITEASRQRRKSYLTEIQREKAQEIFGADYLDFLKSCELKLRLFLPRSQEEKARCLELIQRSNQLNLSGRRYSADEFDALLADPKVFSVAMECDDKFGSYGVVGFASVDMKGEDPVTTNFVMSCRVARKHVEHTFYGWLGSYMKQQGASRLLVELIRTARNGPLAKVFEEMPFTAVRSEGNSTLLAMNLTGEVKIEDIVALDDTAFCGEKVN
jgi:FkbH-like protein